MGLPPCKPETNTDRFALVNDPIAKKYYLGEDFRM